MVADIFMCSIESITSATKKVIVATDDGHSKVVEVPIWNGSLSNILLMSLGPRSAPEILLTIIGIAQNGFRNDDLGPSLIVGSGVFNNLVIAAISICAIPVNEVRRIHHLPIFWTNVCFSLFAYFWLLIILTMSSPHQVEVWEASVTLLLFPLLCLASFAAEKGYIGKLCCCFSKNEVRPVSTHTFLHQF